LRYSRERQKLLPFLVDAMYRTPSNTTTRQWLSDILKFMDYLPFELVCDPIEEMLEEKRFSYRLKRKMKMIMQR
jgi:hypothetical protein